MRYCQGCARVLVPEIRLSFSAAGVPRLPGPAPRPAPPGPPEAVRHKAVHHRVQTAVQTAQGHRDVIGQHLPRPSNLDPEEDQHLPHVEGGEAKGEDHQDSDQQPDRSSSPRPAVLVHQAVAGGEETGHAQGEAHHGQQGKQELQDGEVEESWEEHTGGAELQRCRLQSGEDIKKIKSVKVSMMVIRSRRSRYILYPGLQWRCL